MDSIEYWISGIQEMLNVMSMLNQNLMTCESDSS